MTEILYTGSVTTGKMRSVVAACHFIPKALFLAELFPTHFIHTWEERDALLKFDYFSAELICTDYTSGRIFQEDRELRWEKQGEMWRVVYLGANDHKDELAEYLLCSDEAFRRLKRKDEPAYYYLFGERLRPPDLARLGSTVQDGDFAVVRIPRTLHYPLENKSDRYAGLVVREYVDPTTDRVALFRFQGLTTWSK